MVRRAIAFSRTEEIHDKVIGTFIEREFYLGVNRLESRPTILL
ncbi:hypothetical protein QNE60_002853 [Vibrio harveyi]|nr:hypothetical protein [Vibrio harveyi]